MTDVSSRSRPRHVRRLVDALGRWSATGIIVGAATGLIVSGGLYDGLIVVLGGAAGGVIGAALFAILRAARQRQ